MKESSHQRLAHTPIFEIMLEFRVIETKSNLEDPGFLKLLQTISLA